MAVRYYGKFYRKLDRLSGEIQRRAMEALRTISESKDPGSLGVYKAVQKKDPKGIVYAYEINRSHRLVYFVGDGYLRFACVGDHKVVYGRD